MTVSEFFRRKSLYAIFIIIILLIGAMFFLRGNGEVSFESLVIEPGTLVHTASESGIVKPSVEVVLSFSRSGRIERVLASKGEKISKGETLAVLDKSALEADLRQASALLELEKASIETTEVSFTNTESVLINAIADSYIVADNAVRNKADQLFSEPRSTSPSFGIKITQGDTVFFINANSELSSRINSLRASVERDLKELEKIAFDGVTNNAEEEGKFAEKVMQDVQRLLALIATALNEYVGEDTTVQTVYESYKADISSVRSSINTSLTSLRTALQNYFTAKTSIEVLKQSSDSQTVKLREIRIEEAQARVDSIKVQIKDTYIISPISGIVTDVLISAGEVITATTPAISLISDNNFEVFVDIPEDEISFVDIGDEAKIKFDAYDNVFFEAEVTYISPRAKIVDGVTVFETILQFLESDSRIRAGLTADVDIIAEERFNAFSVPGRAIIERDGIRFVRVLVDETSYYNKPVTLGIRGEGGMVEITSGLETGMRVITFIKSDDLRTFTEVQ